MTVSGLICLERAAGPPAPLAVCGRILEHDLGALAPSVVLIANVLPCGPVCDERTSPAVITASTETGVQRVDRLGIQACDRKLTDSRPDVLLDLADVVDARRALNIEDAQPAVEQLVHRRARAWASALVDLIEELGQNLLGLALRLSLGAMRLDRLAQPKRSLGYRVDAS